MRLEIWAIWPSACYAGEVNQGSYAQLDWEMPCGTKMRDLIERLALPVLKKGSHL